MAERMGVDVRQPVADGELFQPVRDRVRVHGLPVVLGKHEALIAVIFTQAEAFGGLPCPVFSQELHCFHRQGNEPLRPFRLRRTFVNPDIAYSSSSSSQNTSGGLLLGSLPRQHCRIYPDTLIPQRPALRSIFSFSFRLNRN